jgi:type IV secretory pathway VirB2 component (pilin)
LAPLPCEPGTPDCDSSGKLITFNPSGENKIGGYLNVMIRIFIGICAVLAVIMIVVGGIEYMTSELISNKENGRHRITGAIFGLVLALGAWTLLNTINPDLLNTELKSLENVTVNVTLEDQIKSYTGQGKCEPISSSSNPCSPDNLTASGFKNGTQASSICNGESRGNPTLASGVDKCSDGNSFSFGLFQVNILAHANEIPGGVCSGVFQKNGTGTQGTCLQSQSGICIKYDCSVKDTTKYQSCISYITNTTNNIKYALNLQTSRGWGQWGANKSCNF